MFAAEATTVIEQTATREDIADLKVEPAPAGNRMLLAQLALAGLLFAAFRLF